MVSTIHIGLQHTRCQEYGLKEVKHITNDKPCVIYLGGDACDDERNAESYSNVIYQLLKQYKIPGIQVCGTWYEFDYEIYQTYNTNRNVLVSKTLAPQIVFMRNNMPINNIAKQNLKAYYFAKYFYNDSILLMPDQQIYEYYNKNIQLTDNVINKIATTLDEKYIDDLFNIAFISRIKDKNTKLSLTHACKNIRKVILVTHCYGAYVAYQIEQKLKQNMSELGYSTQEIEQILSQLLIINQAPLAPINKFQSTCVNFGSVFDTRAAVSENNFHKYKHLLINNNDTIKPCYLTANMGNLFLVKQKNLHNNENINDSTKREHFAFGVRRKDLSQDGMLLYIYFVNILINGIKNSCLQKDQFVPLPNIKELTTPVSDKMTAKISFDELNKNGQEFTTKLCNDMVIYLKTNKKQGR